MRLPQGTGMHRPSPLRVLAEKAREFNTTLYLSFVDLRKVYYSVNRKALWMVLRKKYNLLDKLVRILRALHHGTSGAVRAYDRVSGEFDITTGVRQGDVLAPTLFNLFSTLSLQPLFHSTHTLESGCSTILEMS